MPGLSGGDDTAPGPDVGEGIGVKRKKRTGILKRRGIKAIGNVGTVWERRMDNFSVDE